MTSPACLFCGATLVKFQKKYCSFRCGNRDREKKPPRTKVCVQCLKAFEYTDLEQRFCGRSCACKHTNAHKTWGCRRSKMEVWLEERLRDAYPDLDLHCNRRDAINAELDFYFPSLKLAFELNGIFHYEPIYGVGRLETTQTNDARKCHACLERGIELCVIDVSGVVHFKPKGAEKFLTIIRDVVARALAQRVAAGWEVQSTDPLRGRSPDVIPIPPDPVPLFLASKAMEQAVGWMAEIKNGLSCKDIARREGCSLSWVYLINSLVKLDATTQRSLLERDPTVGHMTAVDAFNRVRTNKQSGVR